MRYYLDTNIIVYMCTNRTDEYCPEVKEILSDYSNILYTSSTCIHEFIQLCHIGKIQYDKKNGLNPEKIISLLEHHGVNVIYTTLQHLEQMAKMHHIIQTLSTA